ncbi:MAG: leucyl aminopeptidase family protein [Proteobacteria bacterium]|nr:leucyl aminopeptidase family protein [Pseudomonadota bacterium]
MTEVVTAQAAGSAVPIRCVKEDELLEGAAARLAAAADFKGQSGRLLLVPGPDGALDHVLLGVGSGEAQPGLARGLPTRLPPGDYRLENAPADWDPTLAAISFAQGAYVFDRFKPAPHAQVRLVAPEADLAEVRRVVHAAAMARDMVNTPANLMGPRQMEAIAREVAENSGANVSVVTGDALLQAGYPAVHAVGRGATAERAPRMVEMSWGAGGPLIAIVGKGVAFDSGGYNIKPGAGMRHMKKDMGGAAHALALARMIMEADLPVRLVLLLPLVENMISAEAFRPGDVLDTRAGLTVEVGNTDAEGRLILADALTRAGEHAPDLTVDLATLTGAARVALGPQVIPFYTPDDGLAAEIAAASRAVHDPLWRMPLWPGYAEALDSEVAHLSNDGADWAQAGSVTAALFLQRFAPTTGSWVHLDIFAWNTRSRPGWPVGAEAQAVRALYAMLKGRYAR